MTWLCVSQMTRLAFNACLRKGRGLQVAGCRGLDNCHLQTANGTLYHEGTERLSRLFWDNTLA